MALETFNGGLTVNKITSNKFDSTANKVEVWGTSAIVRNISDIVIYACSGQNMETSIDHAIPLRPGEYCTIPLSGRTSGNGDFVSAGAFTDRNNVYAFVVGVQNI